jgi:tetratricopeptide (TPR) repeat protein
MGPLPYPHRATFLASTLVVPAELEDAAPYIARLISLIVFDHVIRHRVVTLGDHDDERLVDENGRLLDAHHPLIEDSIDWFFRVSRRHEVLWFDLSLDPARPQRTLMRCRKPYGTIDEWVANPQQTLAQQIAQCLGAWLAARRLPLVGAITDFTSDDLLAAANKLAGAAALLEGGASLASLPGGLAQPPPRLAIPFLRVLGELSRDASIDATILHLDPHHAVARRNVYVTGLLAGDTDRRAILPLVGEAPMYAKPHLSIWGEPFAGDRSFESVGVRHQGIAASLMPANPFACHNYSLQLAEEGRREESYRWADRATVASPGFGAAHLDCVRRLRQVGRPGQAFAEAQYRCREILDRAGAGKMSTADWQSPHHAALLIAFAHLDVGRIAEAIELADEAMSRVPDDAPTKEAFGWAQKRISHWKTDAGLLARAFAWEGHHRGDPGRVLQGLTKGRITDEEDAGMLIEALLAVGRFDQASVAYWQCAGLDGAGVIGDGKARLSAAKALILNGELDEALDQIQTVQLRRSQSRLEAEINRVLRFAASRPASEWERVIERRIEKGAVQLAQMAARDLADFVPDMDTQIVRSALGERGKLALDPMWISELIGAVPQAASSAAAVVGRLAWPKEATLRAADALAAEWWTALIPPARDRDAHAGGAVLALGIALVNYFEAALGPPTPIAGAYRHIATEALHLVRRSRYQIDPGAIQALLRLVDSLGKAPEALFDTWLLRIERALDLEAEHGAYLEGMIAGLPSVQRYLRGDERVGWELRLAHDLAVDPSQYEPAAMLFSRCARAVEAGRVYLAWSQAASVAGVAPATQVDVHWLASLANPTTSAPWLRLANNLLVARPLDGFTAACRGLVFAATKDRGPALVDLAQKWKVANVSTPLDGERAYDAGVAAASDGKLDLAVQHLRWANACEPGNPKRAQSLAVALARTGRPAEAIKVLSQHERTDAPRLIGKLLAESGRDVDAVIVLRYASRRFRTMEDWSTLAMAAARADNDGVVIEAGRKAIALGAKDNALQAALATALYRTGEFVECEQLARTLIEAGGRENRMHGLHAMARALAGQGRHVDAHPYAKACAELQPNGELAADLIETMDRIVAQQDPPILPSAEQSMERQACRDLDAGLFDSLAPAITSPSWGIARVALLACEFRKEDESGIPVSPRALDAAVAILTRSEGTKEPEACLARVRALRIRDNAFIQIDPPPPLGTRYTQEEFDRAYAERERRPNRPSAIQSFAR